ncbi:c-type cytochrome [Tropicimonas isoalkanivorans]|uniref:Cytochrome c556 n=1 Tax=Tropicimonas isoalkanivorans TaxID=441112 RepID=A0A1I1KBJ2_9RHOB|nr:cytochrome c [Tropicimonas isoalkanivorans]SFC57865.1 Cytochrome c556 [Tropicimonas isoalkanivorans]
MRHLYTLTLSGLAAAVIGSTAFAQDATNPAVSARQSLMGLYAFNLGQLGAIAKGELEYDANTAAAAAGNLAALAKLDQTALWPEGTSSETTEGTRALPVIWSDMDGFHAKADDLAEAATAMEGAAGTDLASLQGAMKDLGAACGACHKEYRQPDD